MDISFKGVTPLVGAPNTLKALKAELSKQLVKENQDYILDEATHLYKGRNGTGQLTQAVKGGKEVGFLITGENVKDVMFMRQGWGSVTAPSRHINNDILPIDNLTNALEKVMELIKSKF